MFMDLVFFDLNHESREAKTGRYLVSLCTLTSGFTMNTNPKLQFPLMQILMRVNFYDDRDTDVDKEVEELHKRL